MYIIRRERVAYNAWSGLAYLDARGRRSASDTSANSRDSDSGYNSEMRKSPRSASSRITACAAARIAARIEAPRYTAEHASAGLDHDFPEIETWPNQFPGYEIVVDDPEFTSVCPKTGLPDFGDIVIRYEPDRLCLELKSLKEYLQAYRNLGIFQENIVNQVLEDVVRWAKPVWAEVKGEFRPRGGISTVVIARWPRGKKSQK
jgi:7-cyano-7-deazaguanine reductase